MTARTLSKAGAAALAALLVIGLALRLAAPGWVLRQVNQRMAEMGDYHGHVEDVTLHLWRGAYELHHLKIDKASGKVPVSLLDAPLIDLSVSWRALLHGRVVATVQFDRPVVSLVDGSGQ
ncbi:MAG TPA: hypothetical protein VHE37_01895 [Nevskiaceae bacterium]|nr:hypothetical protein [Nevskiaceae bacterium]